MRAFSLPWSPEVIVGRLAFKRGKIPAHLEKYIPAKGTCKGVKGFTINPKTQLPTPKVIFCLAESVKKKAGKA